MGRNGRRMLGWVLAGALGSSALAGCGEPFDAAASFTDGRPVPEPVARVSFELPAGAVRIRVREDAPVSLRREVTYRGDRPGSSHQVRGDTLVLEGCGTECEVEYDLVLPRDLPVSGTLGAGAVRVDGAASVDVRADSGEIDLTLREPADVRAETTSGSVTVTVPRSTYQVDAAAGTGRTEVRVPDDPGAAHRIEARAGTGDVLVRTA
ncbi:DUF4097 family beta strand repeat-containing protein [Amycolatopsis aidingensis]|uniref:hypothetical protein n=1 Tax=Amycolatopsis aidingensis TaxID=2842453 RepID=UPI001C0B5960|nr:hypothetical protein [Amycolatopsis aidingensis]